MTWAPMTGEEYFTQEFAKLKAEWDASKHLPALFDAVILAHAAQLNSVKSPEWFWVETANLIQATFFAKRRKGSRDPYTLDYIHQQRWRALSFAFRKRGIEYSKTPGRPKEARGIEEARREAAERLKGSIAAGQPRQIQDSFDKVEKAITAGYGSRYIFQRG